MTAGGCIFVNHDLIHEKTYQNQWKESEADADQRIYGHTKIHDPLGGEGFFARLQLDIAHREWKTAKELALAAMINMRGQFEADNEPGHN